MRHPILHKLIVRALLLGALAPLLIAILWLKALTSGFSIFPTDTYSAYKGWYQPGNAARVTNHYSLDINFIYFPWKFYLASHAPEAITCQTSAPPLTLGHRGVTLPDKSCFPLATSRPYTVLDPRRWLERVLPFFLAYDLGYLLLASLVWLATLITLWRMKFALVPIVLGATVSLGTFWLSKELQYDQYSLPVPFLYLAIACLVGAEKHYLPHWRYGLFSVLVLLVLLSTSLQGILLCGVVFAIVLLSYFVARGWPRYRDLQFWLRFLFAAAIAYGIVIFLISPSIAAFLDQSQRYITATNPLQELLLSSKRALLPFLILITIPTAGLLGSFDTIDPWKVLGWFGGREYVSIDTLTNYCGSLYAVLLVLVSLLTWQKHKTLKGLVRSPALRFWLTSFGLSWLLCVLPTYKFVYFRLIQFTLGLGAPIFVALALEELAHYQMPKLLMVGFKKLTILWGTLWIALWLMAQIVQTEILKTLVISKLGQGGVLGFEIGFWEQRYQRFVDRLSVKDNYALTLFAVQLILGLSLYLYILYYHRKPSQPKTVTWVLTLLMLQGVMVVDGVWHTWNWNTPQQVQTDWIVSSLYWREMGVSGLAQPSRYNEPTPPPNFLILYGDRPPFFYESLNVDRRIKPPENE
uniref:hypothetical protein n=1 Tax=Trichocoleus desertorum TaxID=1481672 RepID=UPI0025B58B76|nr:hypothetical protein [Trichocoleus desertorum]